jgi:hypothetical protein
MPSHVEYVAAKDIDQLTNLIEVATAKKEELQAGGWVFLWVVADYANQGWFPVADYAGAVAYLTKLAQKHLSEGSSPELSLEQSCYRKLEAERLVAETISSMAT